MIYFKPRLQYEPIFEFRIIMAMIHSNVLKYKPFYCQLMFLVASFGSTWAGVKRTANDDHQSKNLVARCTRLDGTV